MNNIRAIEALNQRELEAGIPLSASWHTDWADTAYVYIGGLPYELSEGDIIAIFSQFGEPVHVNLIRDKDTGKSKGFAFLKYEDQRSTSLAVDNLGGATILGRIIRVDHTRYKPKEGEVADENAHQDSSARAGDEDDDDGGAGHRKRRRRRNENDDKREERTPPREMLKEELELQKLIREHDEEDPMKGYLIRQKKDDVEKALEKLKKKKMKVPKHGHESSRSEHGRRSRRHRSQSRGSSRRHRSRSKDRQQAMKSLEGIDHARDETKEVHRQRADDTNRTRDKDARRGGDYNKESGGNGESRKERMGRGQFKGREREIKKEWDVDNEKGRGYYKDLGRTDISRRMKHKDDM